MKGSREGPLQQERADQMRALLQADSGKAVKAMLLKHEWDKKDTKFPKVVAADVRSWTL